MNTEDIKVLKEETTPDGVKIVYAQPSAAVCCKQIAVAVQDGKVLEVRFAGGCSGNTQGVAALIQGMDMNEAVSRLQGIRCGAKATSCPDQLSKVLQAIL